MAPAHDRSVVAVKLAVAARWMAAECGLAFAYAGVAWGVPVAAQELRRAWPTGLAGATDLLIAEVEAFLRESQPG